MRALIVTVLLGVGCASKSAETPSEPNPPAVIAEPNIATAELPPPDQVASAEHPYAELLEPGAAPASEPASEDREPFGDPRGWSNAPSGDPWAVGVMATLANVEWPAWLLEASEQHSFEFKLKVCKDGRVAEVIHEADGVGDPERDAAIEATLEQVRFDPMPEHMTAKMKSDCAKLNYRFRWQRGRIR